MAGSENCFPKNGFEVEPNCGDLCVPIPKGHAPLSSPCSLPQYADMNGQD